jgi:deoxyadenosine/deoxycytidine kinase
MNKKISGDYLDKINSGYLEYIKSQTELNVLIIDVSDKDFVKIKRLPFILNARIKLINYK